MARVTAEKASRWIRPVAIGLGIYLAWKHIASPLLESLELKDSAADKTREKTENLDYNKDYWNPNFYKTPFPAGIKGAVISTRAYMNEAVKKLWDATGVFNDDEQAIYGVFNALKYKTQISFLTDIFFEQKGQNLYQYLRNYLNDSEMDTLLTITNKKPLGFQKTNGTII